MTTVTYNIPNISCGHCVHTIKMEVSDLAGVESVEASADTKTGDAGTRSRSPSTPRTRYRTLSGKRDRPSTPPPGRHWTLPLLWDNDPSHLGRHQSAARDWTGQKSLFYHRDRVPCARRGHRVYGGLDLGLDLRWIVHARCGTTPRYMYRVFSSQ